MPVQQLTSSLQTLTGTFTAGNTLVLAVNTFGPGGGSITSITTNHSETFTLVDNTNNGGTNFRGSAAYLLNCVGGSTTITINTTTNSSWQIALYEYLASDAVSFDVHAVRGSTSGTNPTSLVSGTTTAANETVVGWLAETGTSTPTAGSGFGHLLASSGTNFAALEDKSVTSTGTQQALFTNGTTGTYVCGVLTFKKSVAVTSFNYVINF